jgi:hypothetical protein
VTFTDFTKSLHVIGPRVEHEVTDEDDVVAIPNSTKSWVTVSVLVVAIQLNEMLAVGPSIMFPTLHEFVQGPVSPTINPLVTASRPLITSKIVFTIFGFPSDALHIFLSGDPCLRNTFFSILRRSGLASRGRK